MIVGDEKETETPPLVMVKPDTMAFDVSPLLKVKADEPVGGFINVSAGPSTLINVADLPSKFTDSL